MPVYNQIIFIMNKTFFSHVLSATKKQLLDVCHEMSLAGNPPLSVITLTKNQAILIIHLCMDQWVEESKHMSSLCQE